MLHFNIFYRSFLPQFIRLGGLLFCFLLTYSYGYGQKEITGQVTDGNTGTPLPGVTIKIKGSTHGTISDANGHFRIMANAEDSLVFSFVGYVSKTILVGNKNNLNVELQSSSQELGQLVIVGYGTESKKLITSSISEVNTKGLSYLPISNTGQLLEGRVPGVSISEVNGAPGTPPTILIHGISSINAGIGPLVVIDGFPVGNAIPTSLNPNDIVSISILKDAASTSIYGARGSNGVILIQTIKAEEPRMEVSYNMNIGYQYLPKGWRPKVLNAIEYAEYNKEVVDELNARNNTSNPVPQIFLDVLANPQKYGKGTDWLSDLIRQGSNAVLQNHELTFRGGNEKIRSAISAGYFNQNGLVPNTYFKRYSLRANVEGNFTQWLKSSAYISLARTEDNKAATEGPRAILMSAITLSPLKSPYDSNGRLIPYIAADAPGYFSFPNPIYVALQEVNKTIGEDVNVGLNLDIQIIKGLHYKPQIYSRLFAQKGNTFVPSTIGQPAIASPGNLSPGAPPFTNSATNQNLDITNWSFDNLLTYNKKIGQHSIEALVGYTAQKELGELSQINASGFPTDNKINYLEASQVSASISDASSWSLAAIFGRVNYNYKDKYLASLNFRREGSSRFGSNNKYGNFPSASFGWRVSQEKFYPKDFFMNELKVRLSYGETGNSAIGDFDRFGTIVSVPNINNLSNNYNYVFNDKIVIGKALSSLGDQNLKWEVATQLDVGVDLGFFHDQFTFSGEYYKKITSDMLFDVPIPQASGFTSVRVNIGKMMNRGWDFQFSSKVNFMNFLWNSNLNLSFLQNKVISMPEQIQKIIRPYNVTEVGQPVGALYGYVIEGIFNTQQQLDNPKLLSWPGARGLGAYIYKDVNGDGTIDENDRIVIGDPHPHTILGFNNVFIYKNFSLSILITGAFGYQILPEINEVLYNEKQRWNVSTKFLNRWRSPNDPGDGLIPAIYYQGQHNPSNLWVESGNHVWVKNITLSYSLNKLMRHITSISKIDFFLGVQNAFRFTKYSGFNPEVSYFGGNDPTQFGIDNFSYPVPRTCTAGFDVIF
ncbi:MAG: TonB-dependent receptor [Acidobacterium ailaaui]|nr:TonB-dependent receptor [Pseudacidobacterium ailaaui]